MKSTCTAVTVFTFPEISETFSNAASPSTTIRNPPANWQRMRLSMFVLGKADTLLAEGIASESPNGL